MKTIDVVRQSSIKISKQEGLKMALSYAEKMNEASVMLSGLEAKAERLAKRGLTPEFLMKIKERHNKVMQTNSEQEALKARLKEKTSQLNAECAELDEMLTEARKIVKLEMPPESWKEFGIQAKR